MSKPIVVMEWMNQFLDYWNNKWFDIFPENKYGKVILDTHVYDFGKNV